MVMMIILLMTIIIMTMMRVVRSSHGGVSRSVTIGRD